MSAIERDLSNVSLEHFLNLASVRPCDSANTLWPKLRIHLFKVQMRRSAYAQTNILNGLNCTPVHPQKRCFRC